MGTGTGAGTGRGGWKRGEYETKKSRGDELESGEDLGRGRKDQNKKVLVQ